MAAKKAAKKSAGSRGRSARKSSPRTARSSAKKAKKASSAGGSRKAAGGRRTVKAIPDGYYTATPYLILSNASRAIDFYKRAFGATELMRFPDPSGRIGHAELRIGNSVIMMADEFPERGHQSPQSIGGTGSSIMLYVPNVDAIFDRAIGAGAREMQAVTDQFYGDRSGALEDPFGHRWTIATHTEDVSPDEMQRRMKAMQQGG